MARPLDPEPVAVVDGYRWHKLEEATEDNPVIVYGCSWVVPSKRRGEQRLGNTYGSLAEAMAVYRQREAEGARPLLSRNAYAGSIRI